jgi:hypothetical protein
MNSTGSKAIIVSVGFLLLFGVFGRSVAQEPLLFDLKRVADRPAPDVEKILGKPSKFVDDVFRGSRGSIYPATRAAYMNGAIEVVYLEGGARYLTIWVQKLSGRYQDYSYPKDGWKLLGDLGLDRNTTADLSNQAVTRWRDLPGIYEINVFPTSEKQWANVVKLPTRQHLQVGRGARKDSVVLRESTSRKVV